MFTVQPLHGVTRDQIWWAAHWIYQSVDNQLRREWTRELNRQESIADRLGKFGGKFKNSFRRKK